MIKKVLPTGVVTVIKKGTVHAFNTEVEADVFIKKNQSLIKKLLRLC